MPSVSPELAALVTQVAGHLHAGQKTDAAKLILALDGKKKTPRNDSDALEPIWTFVHFLLSQDNYEQVGELLWTPTMFTSKPECTQRVWKAIRENAAVLLQGASSMSKTYGGGVYFFLDWLRDPDYTTVKVLGPSEDHLQNNLFSHLVTLHQSASIPMPGIVGDLFIGVDRRSRRGAITGVVVPLGRRSAGRLQGTKRFPRAEKHSQFGALSRVRVLLDEFEKIPPGIHADIDNVLSNAEGVDGLKLVGAYNPQDVTGEVYRKGEPAKGWAAFDLENDHEWMSKRGWKVVRLDGERSENFVQGKVIFPGLQTKEGLEKMALNSGGTLSPGYYTFGRAAYPPQGAVHSVIPGNVMMTAKAKFLWMSPPRMLGAVDSALEGGDPAMFAVGEWGVATGIEYPPTVEFPKGQTIMFKDAGGKSKPRHALLLTQLISLPKGDTIRTALEIKKTAQLMGLDPGWLLLDRTGNGSGVHDLLKEIWASEVRAVNYSESATHTKILSEDSEFCDDAYKRIYNEIWFATRKWLEFGVVKIGFSVEVEKLAHQLTTRLYKASENKVEPKGDWKHRNEGKSPNEADALTLLIHCARMASGVTPGMVSAADVPVLSSSGYDRGLPRVGITDRLDDLDRGPRRTGWPRRLFHEETLD
jgi:hypothetical protein